MIKNLLFDLGGVIMEICRQDCIDAFRKLGMDRPEDFLGEYVQAGPFMGIENGSMSPSQFRDSLRPKLRSGVTDIEIDTAFMKFLIGIPVSRLRALRELRQRGYRLGILSNTNPIMWKAKITDEFRKDGLAGPDAYFDGIIRSYKAKVMKPAPEIFSIAARDLDFKPEETIFLDDSQANLDTAGALGFHTLLIAPGEEFMTLLEERLKK
ncbi:MAG: HAD family phosphatase [Pseudoflavonifractor sp.]|nr:HAD family phosphatase [Alloprevotella sp.]MCM1117669.1 HAD family phosphatase [Pseudoflavonifractor sp.]